MMIRDNCLLFWATLYTEKRLTQSFFPQSPEKQAQWPSIRFRLRNDLYCVGLGVKLY